MGQQASCRQCHAPGVRGAIDVDALVKRVSAQHGHAQEDQGGNRGAFGVSDAVAITEYIIALHYGEIKLAPIRTVAGRLFQAKMWREYAQAWDGRPTGTGVGRAWVEGILRVSRAECIRRSRINAYLAHRLNRPAIK